MDALLRCTRTVSCQPCSMSWTPFPKAQPACMQMWDDIALSVASFAEKDANEEAGIIGGGPEICIL
jgi:hypothetical protein